MNAYFAGSGISKSFVTARGRQLVLNDLSISLAKGEILAILGVSGCGKSTLLDILAGFSRPDAGRVSLEGAECRRPGPDRAFVFQSGALFPWLSALENVEAGLRAAGLDKRTRRERALEMLELTGLAGHVHKLPGELSGGMRQRVSLARVLALGPKVLLMDEPFAALDAITRNQMHALLLKLHARFQTGVVMVTHDAAEAERLSHSTFILENGALRPENIAGLGARTQEANM